MDIILNRSTTRIVKIIDNVLSNFDIHSTFSHYLLFWYKFITLLICEIQFSIFTGNVEHLPIFFLEHINNLYT